MSIRVDSLKTLGICYSVRVTDNPRICLAVSTWVYIHEISGYFYFCELNNFQQFKGVVPPTSLIGRKAELERGKLVIPGVFNKRALYGQIKMCSKLS